MAGFHYLAALITQWNVTVAPASAVVVVEAGEQALFIAVLSARPSLLCGKHPRTLGMILRSLQPETNLRQKTKQRSCLLSWSSCVHTVTL